MTVCLVVEDSDTIRAIALKLVESLGVETLEAKTADDAAVILKEKKPGVVILDWDLPKLGAVDFLKSYAALDGTTRPPVILSATENDPQQMAVARTAGVAEIMFKPFDAGQIADVFEGLGIKTGGAPAVARHVDPVGEKSSPTRQRSKPAPRKKSAEK